MFNAKSPNYTPTVLQLENVECGAAALSMILGFYRKFVPLVELRSECGVSRDGSKASNIIKAARRYGLKAKGFSRTVERLKKTRLPAILFWEFNHFVVLEGFDETGAAFINDPAQGHTKISPAQFDVAFTGVVLEFEPGPEFEPSGEMPGAIKPLWKNVRSEMKTVIYCLLAGLALVFPGLLMPALSQVFVDTVLIEKRLAWLHPLLVFMLGVLFIQGFMRICQVYYLRRFSLILSIKLARRFLAHALRLPWTFYAQRFPGEIAQRFALNDQIAAIVAGQVATTVVDLITMIFYCIVMFYYDVTLTVIALLIALTNFTCLQWVAGRQKELNLRQSKEQGRLSGITIATLQNIETIKASGLEDGFFTQWQGTYAKATNASVDVQLTGAHLGLLPNLLGRVSTILVLVIGGLRVMSGDISIGMLVAFQSLMGSFMSPLGTLMALGTTLQALYADIMRVDDVMNNPQDPIYTGANDTTDAEENPDDTSPARLSGRLELRDLEFGYSSLEAPLVKKFNLIVEPGQRVALVGGSGSGKSTIAKLIMGLYQPWTGDILFDGQKREAIPRRVFLNSVAMVEQDILLFGGSVRDNLTLWDQTVPEAYLSKACEDAGIAEVVQALPGGLDATLLEGGANLSGGQRQRLEIARALVRQPALLVLDEATSALDAETERLIDLNLRLRGCTCVIVAHRLSTIRDCDEIIVLDKGRVVERGTHESLWAQGKFYRRLIEQDGKANENAA
jgi:ATP-binding cassette, subfamily C, bacterial